MTYDDWKLRSDRDDAPQPRPESWCSKCEHMECDCPCCNEVSSGPVDYIEPGDQVEGYLSRILQDALARPDALVVQRRVQDRFAFLLLRKGEPDVRLSFEDDQRDAFHNAKQAAHALARAERARKR